MLHCGPRRPPCAGHIATPPHPMLALTVRCAAPGRCAAVAALPPSARNPAALGPTAPAPPPSSPSSPRAARSCSLRGEETPLGYGAAKGAAEAPRCPPNRGPDWRSASGSGGGGAGGPMSALTPPRGPVTPHRSPQGPIEPPTIPTDTNRVPYFPGRTPIELPRTLTDTHTAPYLPPRLIDSYNSP